MSAPRSIWQGIEQSSVHAFSVAPDELAVFILDNTLGTEQRSRFAVLSKVEIDRYSEDGLGFGNWLKKSGVPLRGTTLRFMGCGRAFPQFSKVASEQGMLIGKNLTLKSQSLFQFLPRENRIRMKAKLRVLVVDDSETIRKLLSRIISEDPELECVATVELPSQVERAIDEFKPDVLTLDIHMPEMNGVSLLKKLLPKYALPAIMISSLSMEEGTFVLDALEAGAVDYIQKPTLQELRLVAPQICEKIKQAAVAKVVQTQSKAERLKTGLSEIDFTYLIGIGSSTGGTEALKQVLTRLPAQIPPVLIVQHIPAVFSKAFAERMDSLCPFSVKEAENNDLVEKNTVYIAPGGKQMRVEEKFGTLKIIIEDTAPVNRHKPSVDVLFDSLAALKRKKMVAAILTGMGGDGAKGMLKLKQQGIYTIAQDEASCVVYGMPKEAVKLGGVEKVLPLDLIAEALIKSVCRSSRSAA